MVTGPLVVILYPLIELFTAVCVAFVDTFVNNIVNDVGVLFIFRI